MKLLTLSDLTSGPGAALLESTLSMGFSEPVARRGLQAELDAWLAPGALDRVREELDGIDASRFPREVLIVGAATLPVSTMRACLMARLLGARVLLKPASGREDLAAAIARADDAIEPRCFASSDHEAFARAVASVDTVVALGSDESLTQIASRLLPEQTFVGYGHRVSAVHLHNPGLDELSALASDLLAWDGHGCMSPQVIWTPEEPAVAARAIAEALREVETELPFAPSAEMSHHHYVTEALGAMEGTVLKTEASLLIAQDDPTFVESPGGRLVRVLPDRGAPWEALGERLSALGCSRASTAQPLSPSTRRCPLGEMQRPPLDWPHDGAPNLLPMLRGAVRP